MEQRTDGILLVDKEEGETSFGVVKKTKRSLKIRKVGHAGTLDPFATGLLIVLLGQGTKLSRFLMAGKKSYLARVRLGIETDTLDATGKQVRTHAVPDLTHEKIQEKAFGFVGDIEQVPPLYSAVKLEGRRAYKLARQGVEINLRPRRVTVYSVEVLSAQLPDIEMSVTCSRGTYIRSLGADLGRALGTGGHLVSLRRLSSGPFSVQHALRSGEISERRGGDSLLQEVIPLRAALPDMLEVEVGVRLAKRIRSGYQPSWNELNACINKSGGRGGYVKLVSVNDLVAIGSVVSGERDGLVDVKLERVFS